MAISKQALALVKNKEKELINRKKSKYQDYEADIMFLKKRRFFYFSNCTIFRRYIQFKK